MLVSINSDELARAMGFSRSTVWRHVREGKLRCCKLGRNNVIFLNDVSDYLGSVSRAVKVFEFVEALQKEKKSNKE